MYNTVAYLFTDKIIYCRFLHCVVHGCASQNEQPTKTFFQGMRLPLKKNESVRKLHVCYLCATVCKATVVVNVYASSTEQLGITLYYKAFTVCPGSSDQIYIVTYYIKWVTTSWTYCNREFHKIPYAYIRDFSSSVCLISIAALWTNALWCLLHYKAVKKIKEYQ